MGEEFESAEFMAERGWAQEEFRNTALYAKDVLLGSLNSFSEFYKVPGRPCDKMLGTLNHLPYNVYRYKDHTLLVPADINNDFHNAVDFGANPLGLHYTVISKHEDTFEGAFYTLSFDLGGTQIKFDKLLVTCTVDPDTYKRALQEAGSDEIFFTGKRYINFFERDPKTTRKSVTIRKNSNETTAYAEDCTDIKASLMKYMNEDIEYKPVSNPNASLFEIADSFDLGNIK